MIGNITKSSFFYNYIRYNDKKLSEGKAELLINNTFENSIAGYNHCFLAVCENRKVVEMQRKSDTRDASKSQAVHISLSFHQDDGNISNDTLRQYAKDYLDEMGYGNCPSLVYRHHDTDKTHIHIITSKYDFLSNPVDQYRDWQKSNNISLSLSNKYGLSLWSDYSKDKQSENLKVINSEKYAVHRAMKKALQNPIHNKAINNILDNSEIEYLQKNQLTNTALENTLGSDRYNQLFSYLNKRYLFSPLIKTKLCKAIIAVRDRSTNVQDFVNNLTEYYIYVREVINKKTKKSGFVYGYSGYYFTEGSLKPSVRISNIVSYFNQKKDSLPLIYEKPKPDFSLEIQKNFLQKRISFLLRSNKNISSIADFQALLNSNNIELITHQNKGGIYGISFRSLGIKTPYTFKGSQVGLNINKLDFILDYNINRSKINFVPLVNTQLIEKNPLNYMSESQKEITPAPINQIFPKSAVSFQQDNLDEAENANRIKRKRKKKSRGLSL